MKFNVNHTVRVKLTDIGRNELLKQQTELYADHPESLKREYNPKPEDENGWSEWQLHDLMNRFGHMMLCGFNVPFETTIDIKEGQ